MIKLEQAVIVEGKYDKIRLSNILDAVIITTGGFGIFKNKEKIALIRLMAERRGIIIMTDSDRAGQMIRRHIENIARTKNIVNVYLPTIVGKEKRKSKAGADGVVGVEGTDDAVIIKALERMGITGTKTEKQGRTITKTDLFCLGISGGENSSVLRKGLLGYLNLPDFLTTNALLDVVNSLYGYDDFVKEVEKWKQGLEAN